MKIAIATEGNNVSLHFGRTPQFTLVDIEKNKLVKKETIDNPGHKRGFLPEFFHNKGIDCIIAGGMGHRALRLFKEKGVKVILGITGSVDKIIGDILKGGLEENENLCKPGEGKGYGVEKED